ncbi:tetraspanin-12-like [Cydia splendana]|uniref:tetraspanin-12-like n=1 Tax=Cydia splendana TaxID=1100963 RepID=UPI002133DDA9
MASKIPLHVLNVVFTIFGLILFSGSIAFFCYINMFVTLRNSNHYLLDYNVYWPQAVPWMFFVTSLFVIFSACCGCIGAKRNSKSMVTTYGIFVSVATSLLLGMAIVALVCADGPRTDNFIRDTIWDAYSQMKDHPELEQYFGNVEKRLYCCGADSPRDYVSWRNEFPQSCCDVVRYSFLDAYPIDCSTTNKLANERHGCSEVAAQYARIGIKVLSGVSIFTALIGLLTLAVAFSTSKKIKNRRRTPQVIDGRELETKKVLL